MLLELAEPHILIHEKKIGGIKDLLPVLEQMMAVLVPRE